MQTVESPSMAQIVFAVPAASAKSERVFSMAGNTVTPKRACLAPSKVEQLVTIKTNLRLLRQYGSKIEICFENGVLNFDKNI